MKTETLLVEGMSCSHCADSIEGALRKIDVKAKVQLKKKSVDVEYDENMIDDKKIEQTITDLGYDIKK